MSNALSEQRMREKIISEVRDLIKKQSQSSTPLPGNLVYKEDLEFFEVSHETLKKEIEELRAQNKAALMQISSLGTKLEQLEKTISTPPDSAASASFNPPKSNPLTASNSNFKGLGLGLDEA